MAKKGAVEKMKDKLVDLKEFAEQKQSEQECRDTIYGTVGRVFRLSKIETKKMLKPLMRKEVVKNIITIMAVIKEG